MHQKAINVCVVGVRGRMGMRVARLLRDHAQLRLAVGLERHPDAVEGVNVPIVTDAEQAIAMADVVIDFSAPAACVALAPVCTRLGKAYVVASTGLTPADEDALNQASKHIPVLQAANLSTGVNVMLELVEIAARRLGVDFDIEIGEIHHKHKRDAPSGTSLALGRAVHAGRSGLRDVYGRAGVTDDGRAADEVGYAAMRGGDVSGDHTVYFLGQGERVELTHRSSTSDIFAAGAIKAAHWLAGQKVGRYTMRDALRHD